MQAVSAPFLPQVGCCSESATLQKLRRDWNLFGPVTLQASLTCLIHKFTMAQAATVAAKNLAAYPST
jgi:hypothetical protein